MARFSNGWVKIHRKALLGDIGSNYIRSGLFGTLVAIANLQESTAVWNGRPRKIHRGELVTSLKELAELGDVDEKTVNRHLKYLALRETIILEKSRTGTFIKFLNFEQYQSKDAEGSARGPFGVDDNMEDEVRSNGIHIKELKNKEVKELKKNINSVALKSAALASPTKHRSTFSISNFKDFELILDERAKANYAQLYPDFEFLRREFLKMHNWLLANPIKNRKTKRGWTGFVSRWLDRGWPEYQKSLPSNKADQSNVAAAEVRDRISKLFGEAPHAS